MSEALHFIRSDADYEAAITEYEGYFDNEPEPGSPEGARFEMLALLLTDYEGDTAQSQPVATCTGALPLDQ